MITPTNGRMVWIYHPHFDQPLAAAICWVHSDVLINVCAYWKDGTPFPLQKVTLIQDAGAVNDALRPYATWMPYQKGQAARTEALEEALAKKI